MKVSYKGMKQELLSQDPKEAGREVCELSNCWRSEAKKKPTWW